MDTINENLIVVTNENINNPMFQQAMAKLRNLPLSAKTAYNIGYIAKKIDSITRDGRDAFTSTAKKFGKLDENDNLIPASDNNGNLIPGTFEFKDDNCKEVFEKESKEFMEMTHIISKNKMSVDVLGDMALSANDISALAPLFSDLDD